MKPLQMFMKGSTWKPRRWLSRSCGQWLLVHRALRYVTSLISIDSLIRVTTTPFQRFEREVKIWTQVWELDQGRHILPFYGVCDNNGPFPYAPSYSIWVYIRSEALSFQISGEPLDEQRDCIAICEDPRWRGSLENGTPIRSVIKHEAEAIL